MKYIKCEVQTPSAEALLANYSDGPVEFWLGLEAYILIYKIYMGQYEWSELLNHRNRTTFGSRE